MDKINIEGKEWVLNEFIRELKKFNQAYREGAPLISDKQYDRLITQLKAQYPEHDWFYTIEPTLVPEGRKAKLPVKMKSLDKALSFEEFLQWVKSCGLRGIHKVVLMPKLDGGSLLVAEENKKAYSRGGIENEGQICDIHIERAGVSTDTKFQYTFGEFVISNENWKKNFEGVVNPKTGQPYKAPRNVAVGMLNAPVPPATIPLATYFRYGISGWSPQYSTFSEQIEDICNTYSQPHLYYTVEVGAVTHELFQQLYEKWSEIFGIDGVVVYVDDLSLSTKLGRHHSTGNPVYAIAYKGGFEEEVETEVLEVNGKVSKNGYLRPTVEIEPVGLANSTISNPTGNNMRFVSTNKIAKGAIVRIKRSGEVIPKILETTTPASDLDLENLMKKFAKCPSCGSPTRWNDTGTDIMCDNENCSGIRFAKLFHFFITIGCDGLGEEVFKKLFNNGFDSVKKILNISINDILSLEGLGISTAKLILELTIRIKQGVDLDLLMHASDCFVGIGRKKSFALLDRYGATGINHLNSLVLQPDSIVKEATITEQSFLNGLPVFLKFIQSNELLAKDVILNLSVDKDGKYAGMSICFSGVRDKDLEEIIISEGGNIASGVSKKTTHLVVKDNLSQSSKSVKAKELGVPILTLEEFNAKYQ